MCLMASTCVEIVRYPKYCPLTFTQAWLRTTPIFYTATDTVTDLVNIEHVGNRYQDPIGPVWCIQSIVLTVKVGSAIHVTRWYFNVFHAFFVKKHAAFNWKDTIFGFPVSPGSAETQIRWGGRIKCSLIAYFLRKLYVCQNYRNWTVHVKIIASQMRDVFWDTVYNIHGSFGSLVFST